MAKYRKTPYWICWVLPAFGIAGSLAGSYFAAEITLAWMGFLLWRAVSAIERITTKETHDALATPAQPKASEGKVIERGVRIMEAMPKLQELLDCRRYGEGDEPLLVAVGTDLIDAVMYEVRDQLGGLASEGKAGGEDECVHEFVPFQRACIHCGEPYAATLTAPGADDGQ